VLAAIHFILMNGLSAITAWGVVRALFGGDAPWRMILAGLIAFALVVEAAALVVGTTLGLSPFLIETCLAITAAPAWLAARRGAARAAPSPRAPAAGDASPGWTLLAAGLLGAAAGAWAGVSLFDGTRFSIDDFTYHAAVPAGWLQADLIHLVPFTYQSYYPHNPELLTLWFMLPFHADGLASLGSLWGAAVLALAAFGLTRRLGGSTAAAGFAAALVACSGVPLLNLGGFARADLIGAAAAMAGLALAGPRLADLAMAGLAIGYAAGCRVSFATVLPCVMIGLVVELRGAAERARLLRGLAILAGAAALACGYWYLQNAVLTGNPLYPAAFGPFDGPLGAAAQARTSLASWIARRPLDGGQWWWIFVRIMPGTIPFVLLALVGGATAMLGLGRDRGEPARRRLVLLILLVAAVQVAQFPFMPFSGTYNRPTAGLEGIATRYLLLPFALGIACFTGLTERAFRRPFIGRALAAATLVTAAWPMALLYGGAALAIGVVAGAAAGMGLARRRGSGRPPGAWIAGGVTALLLVALAFVPVKQRRTDANLFGFGTRALPIGAAFRALESLPRGSRIALFMAEPGDYNHYDPLFGRRLQYVPVPVERDGSARPPLHQRGQRGWWSDWERLDDPVDPARLRSNLAAAGVDHVLVTRWTLGTWPPQRATLEAIPEARKLFDDGASAVYSLR